MGNRRTPTVSSTDTRSSVLDRLVTDGEFCEIMASHLRLYLHAVEDLSIIDSNNASNHLWDNNHVSQVCLNDRRLFVRWSSLFRQTQLFDETHRTAFETSLETTTGTGMDKIDKLKNEQHHEWRGNS